uniref:RNA-dependent RNA polymerase n=1 Tax=Plasmopara viticola lesion associated mitovirus 33 TaxID=2719460 RepID=A0A6G9RVB6_9VIRU|nr:RNA-dependent RNA polymerase [Plasmopara viticola lesion associated mitovirus 33]
MPNEHAEGLGYISYLYILNKATNNKIPLQKSSDLALKILRNYVPEAYSNFKVLIDKYFAEVNLLVNSRGIHFTIRYIKESRNAIMRYISEEPLSKGSIVKLSNGFPHRFRFLLPMLESKDGLKILHTLFIILRNVRLKAEPSFKTIEGEWNGKDTISEFELLMSMRMLGVPKNISPDWDSFHISTKSGTQGPALLTSLTEATLLPRSLIEDINLLGGGKLARKLDEQLIKWDVLPNSIAGLWTRTFPVKSQSLRKLSYFSDKEGKTREIAILDYWSQSSLYKLHRILNGVLRKIPSDCTYKQNGFREVLPPGKIMHSLDLTAATDRMPIALQKRVISFMIGSEKSDAWERILVGRPFVCKGFDRPLYYKTGQPMGAYSSWPAMALTHHTIVQVSAIRAGQTKGFKPFTDYALLGDDLVIANCDVAREYKLLLHQLDMPISFDKSHVSKDTYEFAKRWIVRGEEITGFSISGLFETWKKYPLLKNFLDNQSEHGWNLERERHPDLILDIFKVMKRGHFIFEHVLRIIKLYKVFCQLSDDIKTGNSLNSFNLVKEIFGFEALGLSEEQINLLPALAKKRLIEKDIYTFQCEQEELMKKFNLLIEEYIQAWADPTQHAFLREVVPVMVSADHPLLDSLERLVDQATLYIMAWTDPDIDRASFYLNSGLMKYHISKGIFSMRNSHQLALSEAAIVKAYISLVSEISPEWDKGQLTLYPF